MYHRERRRLYRAPAVGVLGRLSVDGVVFAVTPIDGSAAGVLVALGAGADAPAVGAAVVLELIAEDGAATTRRGSVARVSSGADGARVAIRFDPDEAVPVPPSLQRVLNRRRNERVAPVRPTPVDLVVAPGDTYWRSFVSARLLDASMAGVAVAMAPAQVARLHDAALIAMRVYFDGDPVRLYGEIVGRTRIGVNERLGLRLVWDQSPTATDSRAALRDWLMHRRFMTTWSPGPTAPKE